MSTADPLADRLLEAVRSGAAARPVRLAGARGALPLPPAVLAALQVLLLDDGEDEVRAAAAESLAALDAGSALALAADADAPAEILAWLAAGADGWPEAAATLAGRRTLPREAGHALARCTAPAALDALALNHELLFADPLLARALALNPNLGAAARSRLLDTIDELAKERPQGAAPTPPPAQDPRLAAFGIDAEIEALLPALDLDLGQLADMSELLGSPEDGDEASLYARLSRMNIGQKLRVALLGTREERRILVRDTNRIVAAAVIKNPKFSQPEAEAVSTSRNVGSDTLRLLARHREYSKLYSLQHNLVRNPRCPIDLALNMVAHLNDHDLKLLMKNRNVADAVRRHGRKILEAREARRRVRVGK
ncbi:MAG: hypothetical protein KBD01_01005 [Acidobacteria bacterium]|nr:hypothetical protein [Acidobacteriota bacterium]